jgi:hypothetical protein
MCEITWAGDAEADAEEEGEVDRWLGWAGGRAILARVIDFFYS